VPSPSSELAARRRREFGARLRQARAAAELSQEGLAARSGMHRTYVGSVERGERNISLDNIYRLADALGMDVRDLFGSARGP
jgi:transcriptional regulator with XRE-family HTH domain